MSKHTPEPWEAGGTVVLASRDVVADCESLDDLPIVECEANAHRIVSAVNFTAGIPLPEDVTLKDVLEALRDKMGWQGDPRDRHEVERRARALLAKFQE